MIANILNTVIGLWLGYAAIFEAAAGRPQTWPVAAAAAAIVVLALIARRSDPAGWHSAADAALGAVLLVLALVNLWLVLPALVMFWLELWIGLAVASFALWAVLYRPETETGQERRA
jgi:hypothetical protein